jgi:hypothetical protein
MKKSAVASAVIGALAVVTSQSAFAGQPTLHSNADPPAPRNPSAAAGRSGTASLTARVLLNKDGTSDVDVTTGALDSSAAAPGNISKLQIKTFNGAGDVQWTKNYASLTSGGRLHYNFADIHRGQPIQTQANIKAIDGKRTDVVTVTGNAKLRPDVTVRKVVAPGKVRPGDTFNIDAVVGELNGDVGAKGDCKLFVDGVQVDQSLGIFVDGGGTVSCAFTQSLTAIGTHTLRAVIDGVVPADWDTANNAAEATIEVANPEVGGFVWFQAWASAWEGSSSGRYDGWYRQNDGTWFENRDWTNTWGQDGRWQDSGIYGNTTKRPRFPLTHVQGSQTSNGATFASIAIDDMPADWSWGDDTNGDAGASFYDGNGYFYAAGGSSADSEYGYVQYSHWAGDYVYWSYHYEQQWYGYVGGATTAYTYSYNNEGHPQAGQWIGLGDTTTIAISVVDSRGVTTTASPSFDTPLYVNKYDQPYTCNESSWTWGTERWCSEYHGDNSQRYGYISGSTP